MRRAHLCCGFMLVLVGCSGGEGGFSGAGSSLQGSVDAAAFDPDAVNGDPSLLDCVNGGGSVGDITVVFECDEITVHSCKDISNVVIEYADGTRERYEGGMKQVETLAGSGGNAGKVIVGVWVKAGDNHSGDGPGYGERFDAPIDTCDEGDDPPPTAGTGGDTGGAGVGGSEGVAGVGGGAGSGGEACDDSVPDNDCGGNGEVPGSLPPDYCTANPSDPICSPD